MEGADLCQRLGQHAKVIHKSKGGYGATKEKTGDLYKLADYRLKVAVGILCLIPPISLAAWIIDLITEITDNKIKVLAD